MLLVLGPQLLSQPWLFIALAIYAANLLIAFFDPATGPGSTYRHGPTHE